jgi:hypothetical protein
MTFFEAKIRAMCNTRQEIFEKAYNCKLPQDVKDKDVEYELNNMKPLIQWIERLKDNK